MFKIHKSDESMNEDCEYNYDVVNIYENSYNHNLHSRTRHFYEF